MSNKTPAKNRHFRASARRFFTEKKYLRHRRWTAAVLAVVVVVLVLDVARAIRIRRVVQASAPVTEVKWVGYADGYLGVRLSYPESWRLLRNDGEKSLSLYTPDSRYILSFCVANKENIDVSCVKGNNRSRSAVQDGSVRLFNLSVPREKVAVGSLPVEYYYPKDPTTIGNGQTFFAAAWYANQDKVKESEIDIDGYRPVAEQILATLQQVN